MCEGCIDAAEQHTGKLMLWQLPGISCCVAVSFSAGQRGSLSPDTNMQGQLSFKSGPACRSACFSERLTSPSGTLQEGGTEYGDGEEGLLTESWGLVSGCPSLLALLAFVGWGGSCTTNQEGVVLKGLLYL